MKVVKAQRPVYGYIFHKDLPTEVGGYGSASVVFKPEVKKRVTVTYGDSLGKFSEGEVFATPATRPGPTSFDSNGPAAMFMGYSKGDRAPKSGWAKKGSASYLEAQYHGQLSVSDIAKVILSDSAYYPPALLDRLKEAGIPYEFTDYPGYSSAY